MTERSTVYFQLRLTPEDQQRIKALAGTMERSQHWIGLRALRLGLSQLEQQQSQPS